MNMHQIACYIFPIKLNRLRILKTSFWKCFDILQLPGIVFENFFFSFLFYTPKHWIFNPHETKYKRGQVASVRPIQVLEYAIHSDRTCAGNAALASPPPLSSSMCFLMVFISLMVAPFWDRVLVSAASSSNVMGGQGRGKRADPPPLERKNEIIDNAVRLFMFRARAVTGTHPHNL